MLKLSWMITEHAHDLFGIRVMEFRKHLHKHCVLDTSSMLKDRTNTVAPKGFNCNKQIADAVSLISVIFAPYLAGLHRNWLNCIPNQLAGTLVEVNHRTSWIIGQLMLTENIFHMPNEFRGDFTNAPHLPQMWPQFVFFRNLRKPSYEIVSTNPSSTALSASRRSVQRFRPSGGSEQARAVMFAAVSPSSLGGFPDRGISSRLLRDFSIKNRLRALCTVWMVSC